MHLSELRKASTESSSQCAADVVPTKSTAPKIYERKPRRKTRVDRYDPKVSEKRPHQSSETGNRHKRKRRWKKKAGTTLNQDFYAPNVHQERLTVREFHS